MAFNIVMYLVDPSMQGTRGPAIIAFEFAGSKTRATQIMAEWGSKGPNTARLSLWIDYGLCRRRHKPYYVDRRIMGIRG
jgi:hypothetical protein